MYIIELDVELRHSPIKSGKSQISNLSFISSIICRVGLRKGVWGAVAFGIETFSPMCG
jgi:hypothetical protein